MELRLLKTIPTILLAATLASCASGPTPNQLSSADYGSAQSPQDCKRVAENFIKSRLKDPSSAQFTHNDCHKDWVHADPALSIPLEFGYLQSGQYNAKNSYGGYTGFSDYKMLIINGSVARYCDPEYNGAICFPE
jgi:hypothetical protein